MCSQWEEIALIIRDGQFSADEEHHIDVLDVKVCTCVALSHYLPVIFFDIHYLPRASNSMLSFSNLWRYIHVTTFLFDRIARMKELKCILCRNMHNWSFVCFIF